jgi:hypothetical protein
MHEQSPRPYGAYRHRQPNYSSFGRFLAWWNGRRVGLVFLLLACAIALGGLLYERATTGSADITLAFYANLSTELASIAITVLIIDALAQRRANAEHQARLLRELRSPDNGIALRALTELFERGWAADGSLHSAYLLGANLANAFLREVDLRCRNLISNPPPHQTPHASQKTRLNPPSHPANSHPIPAFLKDAGAPIVKKQIDLSKTYHALLI